MMNYRKLLSAVVLIALGLSLAAWKHGVNSNTPNRILIVGMGQSNMGTFLGSCDSPCSPPNPPTPAANTASWNGATLTLTQPPFPADGITVLQNTVASATGLPNVAVPCEQGGSPISGFVQGTTAFNSCRDWVNSIIGPRDQVILLWIQGEGDTAAGGEVPDFYAPILVQLHQDFAAAIGRTIATAPMIYTQLGSASGLPGTIGHGTSQQAWHTITNSQAWAPFYEPGGHLILSSTNYDVTRTDGYHYDGVLGTKFIGQRFAQVINTLMGVASQPGIPNWNISGASTVDATHTTVALTHSLGTDFTPTSGITSFEVSGDNGASWSSAVGSRSDATHISLLHSSLTTTNARLVRYLYGFSPPDADINCDTGIDLGPCAPPSALVKDNSSLAVPLAPTTWDLRPTGGTTLPMPTWRDTNTGVRGSCSSTCTDNISGLQLGPETVRKFVIVSIIGIDTSFSPVTTWTLTPQDFLGNNVGTPTTQLTPTPIARAGKVTLYAVALNSDATSATTLNINVTYSQQPFGNTILNLWTVPFADLSSTTATGSNATTTTSTTAITTTLNTSAGGFTVCAASNSNNPNSGNFSGWISGTVLTATGASSIPFVVGQAIASAAGGGPGEVRPNTFISSFGSGTGGAGTYNLTGAPQVVGSAGASFTGSITGSTLTVSGSVTGAPLAVGQDIAIPSNPNFGLAVILSGSGTSWTLNTGSSVASTTMTVDPHSLNNTSGPNTLSSSTGENLVARWGTSQAAFDAANSPGSTPASFTETFNDAGNLALACAAWR